MGWDKDKSLAIGDGREDGIELGHIYTGGADKISNSNPIHLRKPSGEELSPDLGSANSNNPMHGENQASGGIYQPYPPRDAPKKKVGPPTGPPPSQLVKNKTKR